MKPELYLTQFTILATATCPAMHAGLPFLLLVEPVQV